ncbi:MAG TPA: RNA polymerase sigma factor [Sandaracinaceae bacterium LLY-WYZ-13_1]|nr:RNA polymerase sigma factor [Sandaracinaceae bacterium LLY-WYZ-13_1]
MSADPVTTDPLAPLCEAAANGDRAALGRLLRALGPQVLRVARGVLGSNHPDVEDAAQESMVAIASALSSFRGESSVTHFACRIAARRCVTVRRRAKTRRERREALATEPPPPPVQAPRVLRREALRELLETLPEEQAESLVLRVVMGFSLGEVAEATGAPINTVRSRLRLSKEALRRRIEADPMLAESLEVES